MLKKEQDNTDTSKTEEVRLWRIYTETNKKNSPLCSSGFSFKGESEEEEASSEKGEGSQRRAGQWDLLPAAVRQPIRGGRVEGKFGHFYKPHRHLFSNWHASLLCSEQDGGSEKPTVKKRQRKKDNKENKDKRGTSKKEKEGDKEKKTSRPKKEKVESNCFTFYMWNTNNVVFAFYIMGLAASV